MKKGPVELGANEEEVESESKVTNQIFGCLQHPKNEVRYLENIFSDFRSVFFHLRFFFTKVLKTNIIAFIKTKIAKPVFFSKNFSFAFFEFYSFTPLHLS